MILSELRGALGQAHESPGGLADPRWYRVLAALTGGYADLDVVDGMLRDQAITRYIVAADQIRQESFGTLPSDFREVIHDDDAVYALAVHLDDSQLNKAAAVKPEFQADRIWRCPKLGDAIVSLVRDGESPLSLVSDDPDPETAAERSLAALMLGLGTNDPPTPETSVLLEQAAEDLRDAAFRALIALLAALSKSLPAASELPILLDVISTLAAEFDIPFNIFSAPPVENPAFAAYAREHMARWILGQGDNSVYEFAVFLERHQEHVMQGLAQIGASGAMSVSQADYDLPCPQIPSAVGDNALARFLDVLDIAESCPPESSLTRTAAIEFLGSSLPNIASARLELAALNALDWGPQSERSQIRASEIPVDSDAIQEVVTLALASPDPGTRARAILRVLRPLKAAQRAEVEPVILAAIEGITDPFEAARTWEMLASRTSDPDLAAAYARRARATTGVMPENRACLLCRISVLLPTQERAAVLQEAVDAAARVPTDMGRTEILRLIRPYALRSSAAAQTFHALANALAPLAQAYLSRQRGEALRLLFDGPSPVPAVGPDTIAPLVAYALISETLARSGTNTSGSLSMEYAVTTTSEGRRALMDLFEQPLPPRIPPAGILVLLELVEGGYAEDAGTILGKVSQYPVGAVPLARRVWPNDTALLPNLIDAAAFGLSSLNAAYVVSALSDPDDLMRARATMLLQGPKLKLSSETLLQGRRASTLGSAALSALSGAACHAPIYARLRVAWFMEHIVFDTGALAHELISLARQPGEAGASARRLTEQMCAATPDFLLALLEVASKELSTARPADVSLADSLIRSLAAVFYRTPWITDFLPMKVVSRQIRRIAEVSSMRVYQGQGEDIAKALLESLAIDGPFDAPELFGRLGLSQRAAVLLSGRGMISKLKAVGMNYFSRDEFEEQHQSFVRPARELARARGGAGRLAEAIAQCLRIWDRQGDGSLNSDFPEIRELSDLFVMAASIANEMPDTIGLALENTGVLSALSRIAESFPSYPARRAAFLLMPLRWRRGRTATEFDDLSAIIAAAYDVPQVRDAAELAVGQIKDVSRRTLDTAYRNAAGSPQKCYVLARALIRICANDGTIAASSRAAQEILSDMMGGPVGVQLLHHHTMTASSPPRSKLSELIFHEAVLGAV